MNASEKRILLPLLKRIHHGETPSFRMRSAAQFLLHRLGKPSKKGKKASAARKTAKAVQHRDLTARIREAVMQRAGGACEACTATDETLTLDHWLGGSGRRRQKQSVENTWALCGPSHQARQANHPSVEFWNRRFRKHCERHGYPVIEHIIHQQLSTQGSEDRIPPNAAPVSGGKGESNG